jgi:hypothetical protein
MVQKIQALLGWENSASADDEIVPDSRPTPGQVTGDMGVLGQERRARNENVTAFTQREANQNSARRALIEQQAPSDADVMRAPSIFRDHREAIDRATQFAVDALM